MLDWAPGLFEVVDCVQDLVLRVASGEARGGDGEEACTKGRNSTAEITENRAQGNGLERRTGLWYVLQYRKYHVHGSAGHSASPDYILIPEDESW